MERKHQIEKKDIIYNISRDFNISHSTKLHKDDATSVELWVYAMQALNENCPVIFYKEQGIECKNDLLEKNDFILIIMTPFQKEQLTCFGHDEICIDGSHGTNSYNFNLFMLLTVDEYGFGCPVAFCISNRADQLVLETFFSKIKSVVGVINAKIFMSDDAPSFYNAWKCIMSDVPHRLLCIWHVDGNWRKNLNKISGGQEKKVLVYKTLCSFTYY